MMIGSIYGSLRHWRDEIGQRPPLRSKQQSWLAGDCDGRLRGADPHHHWVVYLHRGIDQCRQGQISLQSPTLPPFLPTHPPTPLITPLSPFQFPLTLPLPLPPSLLPSPFPSSSPFSRPGMANSLTSNGLWITGGLTVNAANTALNYYATTGLWVTGGVSIPVSGLHITGGITAMSNGVRMTTGGLTLFTGGLATSLKGESLSLSVSHCHCQ